MSGDGKDPIAPVSLIADVKRQPPKFTEREIQCIAWLVSSLAWIPNDWANEIGALAKKLRVYLGDET